jgi:hypothetical protein
VDRKRRLLLWIAAHDDSWVFTLLYVGLAVVLSIAISLFWLVAVVAAHAALEWYALRHAGVVQQRVGRVLWHLKLDLALILFALALGLYLETLFGMAGLGAVARTGAQAGARFVGWKHALRGLLMTVDDMAQVAKAVARRGQGSGGNEESFEMALPPWRRPWRTGDRLSLGFGALCLVLILAAPWLSGLDAGEVLAHLRHDLHPWPP